MGGSMAKPPRVRGSIEISNASVGGRIDIHGDTVEIRSVSAGGDIHIKAQISAESTELARESQDLERGSFFATGIWRDADRKTWLGVASGIAWKLEIDPFWIRVAFVAGMFVSFGVAVLVYLGLAIAMTSRSRRDDDMPPELVEAWREVNEITRHE